MKGKRAFALLCCHTDRELSDFLMRKAKKGWLLKAVRGNTFVFKCMPYGGKRICSYTFTSRSEDETTEESLLSYLPILRDSGWDTLCYSKPESIADVHRHVFLIEEKENSEIPLCEEGCSEEVIRKARRKSLFNFISSLIFSICLCFVIRSDWKIITSSCIKTIMTAILGICLVLSVLASLTALTLPNDEDERIGGGRYRAIDISSRLMGCSYALLALFILAM